MRMLWPNTAIAKSNAGHAEVIGVGVFGNRSCGQVEDAATEQFDAGKKKFLPMEDVLDKESPPGRRGRKMAAAARQQVQGGAYRGVVTARYYGGPRSRKEEEIGDNG